MCYIASETQNVFIFASMQRSIPTRQHTSYTTNKILQCWAAIIIIQSLYRQQARIDQDATKTRHQAPKRAGECAPIRRLRALDIRSSLRASAGRPRDCDSVRTPCCAVVALVCSSPTRCMCVYSSERWRASRTMTHLWRWQVFFHQFVDGHRMLPDVFAVVERQFWQHCLLSHNHHFE